VLFGTRSTEESGTICVVDRPAISVIIPCYNEAELLPRLLTSIETARRAFSGGSDAVEVVVADNASTDGTAAIAYARGYRVASSAIRRIGAVRNAGAAVARGAVVRSSTRTRRSIPRPST